MIHKRIARRDLLKAMVVSPGWLFWAFAPQPVARRRSSLVAAPPLAANRIYLPLVRTQPNPSRVVQIHSASATHWDFVTGWHGDHVSATAVEQMVQAGLMRLTATSSVREAWETLIPAYHPGDKIAIKVNLNNARCSDDDNAIDALIEPVNALIGTLVSSGIQQQDVWVYDATREMPERFYGRRRYTGARFFARGCADELAPFDHQHPSLRVQFTHPALVVERWLTDLLYRATYVINMPILKKHGIQPVTLGFKNHFGSLSFLTGAGGDDDPHIYYNANDPRYRADYSPLVDINANPNIAGKTVLTLGDGLFGSPWATSSPQPWRTFGGQAPNSLFFSRDRVAVDSVMCDLVRSEFGFASWPSEDRAYDYLRVAQSRGLGTFERGDPWGSGYQRIEYLKEELSA